MSHELDAELQTIAWALGLQQEEVVALGQEDFDLFRKVAVWRWGAEYSLRGDSTWKKWPSEWNPLLDCDPNGVPYPPYSEAQQKQFTSNSQATQLFLYAWWAPAAQAYLASTMHAIDAHNALAAARNATNLAMVYLATGNGLLASKVCKHVREFTARSSLGQEMFAIRKEAITIARMALVAFGNADLAGDEAPWLVGEPAEMKKLCPLVRRDVSGALRRAGREDEALRWETLYTTTAMFTGAARHTL